MDRSATVNPDFTRSKQIYRIGRSLKFCRTVHYRLSFDNHNKQEIYYEIISFRGLMMTDLFVVPCMNFQIQNTTIKLNQHFIVIFNLWIVVSIKRIKMISQPLIHTLERRNWNLIMSV